MYRFWTNVRRVLKPLPKRYSSIKDAGGKWSDLQKAREGQYFAAQNNKVLQYIKEEIKKGRKIEDILEDVKKKIEEIKQQQND